MTTYQFIWQYLKRYKREAIIGVLFLIITNIMGTLFPLYIKSAVDKFSSGEIKWSVDLFVGLGLIVCFMATTRVCSRICLFGIGRQVELDEKQKFYKHILQLDYLYFNTQRIGDLISRSTSDVQAIRQMMGFGLLNVINIVWAYGLTLPILFSLNASLTMWLVVGYAPILFAAKLLSNKIKKLQQSNQEKLGHMSSFIEEDLNGIQVIKAYTQENREIQRFKAINADYLQTAQDLAQIKSLVWPILNLTRLVSFIVVISYATQNLLTAGTIAALLIYLERLVFPTAIMGWLITIMQRGAISVSRLSEIYQQSSHISTQGDSHKPEKFHLSVRDLSYSYGGELSLYEHQTQNNDNWSLTKVSLDIPEGSFTGITGMIGSGKTTLAMLSTRILNNPSDSIYLGGVDINVLPMELLRQHIRLVPQTPYLFNMTVRENLTMLSPISDKEIYKVCEICQIDEEIEALPEGLDTIIGEKGLNLSGGQAQRISLARALLQGPSILILDHTLSSVDNETAQKILSQIRTVYSGMSIVLITHRISSLQEADNIYVMHQGQINCSGRHIDLLEKEHQYQKLAL